MTTKSRKLTDSEIVYAYAMKAIHGGTLQDHLEGRRSVILRAIGIAIKNGNIRHSGNPENGWLTSQGIELLPKETRPAYRAAVRQKTAMRAG